MVTLKSIGVLSVAKVLACIYAMLGLLIGGLFSLMSLVGFAAGGANAGPAALLFGIGAIIILPIFYGVIGFIGGAVMAVLYNVVASIAGGFEFELQQYKG